jgi:hypothetical protein
VIVSSPVEHELRLLSPPIKARFLWIFKKSHCIVSRLTYLRGQERFWLNSWYISLAYCALSYSVPRDQAAPNFSGIHRDMTDDTRPKTKDRNTIPSKLRGCRNRLSLSFKVNTIKSTMYLALRPRTGSERGL